MNMIFKHTIRLGASLLAGLLMVSCFDDAMKIKLEELGTQKDTYELPFENGTLEVEYFSNLTGSIHFTEDIEWAKLSSERFDGDGKLMIEYKYNSGFPRMAKVVFESDDLSRIDTIRIKQHGEIIPTIQLKKNNLIVYNNETGDRQITNVLLKTNLDLEDCDINIKYTGLRDDEEPVKWVKGTTYANGILMIETENNTFEVLRNAIITISFTDGWGVKKTETLFLTQATKDNKLGTKATFDEVRSMVSPMESLTINEDIYIEGYIISDVTNGNVAENPMTTNTSIDYKRSDRCAYIESIDGKYGFLLEASSVDDNNLRANTKVQLLLKNTSLEHMVEPDRFTIKGFTAAMVIYSEKVSEESIPVKECRINNLTDEDMYTLVKLKDCEFPIRKGSLFPINEGYANSCLTNRINMFPTLIRDIEGKSMYVLTNSTCPYRRDGSRINYGKGSVKGVLVHEKYRRFIDGDHTEEAECGNIGRYQIRHQRKEDIAFENDFNSSFSKLLTEYRYMQPKAGGAWAPTYGENGEFRHTYVDEEHPNQLVTSGEASFSYLGPVGNNDGAIFGNNKGNVNGFGIILEDGTNWGMNFQTGVNDNGKGYSSPSHAIAFKNGWWWDENKDRPYAWLIEVSTKGISTNQLSMQLAMINYSQHTPSNWIIEWSENNSMEAEADHTWKEIAKFYVPDIVNWSPTQPWQSAGYKPMNFVLPLEMLGKDKIYIRIMPQSKVCSSEHGFADGQMNMNGEARNAIDYFAIRYNR